jgi:hypothetical protein
VVNIGGMGVVMAMDVEVMAVSHPAVVGAHWPGK